MTLPDGRMVCFIGGAYSMDRSRKPGTAWWPDKEILDPEVLDHLRRHTNIMVAHTAPNAFRIPGLRKTLRAKKLVGIRRQTPASFWTKSWTGSGPVSGFSASSTTLPKARRPVVSPSFCRLKSCYTA